jgi:DNA-binding LytR/AlgR family response regulator
MFFESTGRKVEIVTMNDRYSFYSKLDEVEQNPDLQNFLRCHQSYLINPDYILEISSNSILLTNHESLPVSRGAYKQIKEKFFFSYLSKLDNQL